MQNLTTESVATYLPQSRASTKKPPSSTMYASLPVSVGGSENSCSRSSSLNALDELACRGALPAIEPTSASSWASVEPLVLKLDMALDFTLAGCARCMKERWAIKKCLEEKLFDLPAPSPFDVFWISRRREAPSWWNRFRFKARCGATLELERSMLLLTYHESNPMVADPLRRFRLHRKVC